MKPTPKKLLLLCAALLCVNICTRAQNFALKTNLLYDALLNISLGGEMGLSPRWSLSVEGTFNDWSFSHDRRWRNATLQPELRYWLCQRHDGHFFGLHVQGGTYNVGGLHNSVSIFGYDFSKLSHARYQGWFAGAGLGYGYSWILSRHWNVEGELGIGYNYTRYDRYRCAGCGRKDVDDKPKHYFGPTKAALSMVYIF